MATYAAKFRGNKLGDVKPIRTIDFDINYSDGVAEGRLQWNSDDGTLEFGMPGGSVNLQVGQEVLVRAKNTSGSQINDGIPVYISGATGSRPEIAPADADNFNDSIACIGITTEAIANNQFGYVTIIGLVRDIDTSSWSDGDYLYIASGGGLTNVAPGPPAFITAIGAVLRSHETDGIIGVRIEYRSQYPEIMYDDLQVGISNIRVPVANAPTERFYDHGISGGVTFPVLGFALGDYFYFDVQTTHGMKLNTVLDNHLHFTLPNTTNIGDKFNFQLDVITAGIEEQWSKPSGSPYTSEHTIVADDDSYHRYLGIADIESSNTTVSTIYKCKLTRIAASANEYASEVYVHYNDCHYQKNTIGSRTEMAK